MRPTIFLAIVAAALTLSTAANAVPVNPKASAACLLAGQCGVAATGISAPQRAETVRRDTRRLVEKGIAS
jgi:hypothetical protein